MTRGKRTPLRQTSARDRNTSREAVAIPALCRIGERCEEQVLVTDLNTGGCRMHTAAVGVTRGEPLELTLPGCEALSATLAWIKGGSLGVRFASPLGEDQVNMLCSEVSADNVVPLRG